MKSLASVTVVKRARDVRQHEPTARVAAAQPTNCLHIARVRDAIGQHDVQHHDAIVIMTNLHVAPGANDSISASRVSGTSA